MTRVQDDYLNRALFGEPSSSDYANQVIDMTLMGAPLRQSRKPMQADSVVGDLLSGFASGASMTLEAGARLPSMAGSAARGVGQTMQQMPVRTNFYGEADRSDLFFQDVRQIVGRAMENLGRTAEQEFEGGREAADVIKARREGDLFQPSDEAKIPYSFRWFINQGGSGVGTFAPGILTGGVVGTSSKLAAVVGGIVAGATEAGTKAADYEAKLLEQGFSEEEARSIAALGAFGYGTASGIVETLPLMKIFSKAPSLRAHFIKTLESAVADGTEEAIQTFLDKSVQVMAHIDDDALANMTVDELIQAFTVGGLTGGAFGFVTPGFEQGTTSQTPASEQVSADQTAEPQTQQSPSDPVASQDQSQPDIEPQAEAAAQPDTVQTASDSSPESTADPMLEAAKSVIAENKFNQVSALRKQLNIGDARARRLLEAVKSGGLEQSNANEQVGQSEAVSETEGQEDAQAAVQPQATPEVEPGAPQSAAPAESPVASSEDAAPASPVPAAGILDRLEQGAAARIRERGRPSASTAAFPGARGGSAPIFGDLADYAVIFAVRGIKAGVKGGQAISEFVVEQIKTLGEVAGQLNPFADELTRETRRIMREAVDENGQVDESRLEHAADRVRQRVNKATETIKSRINKAIKGEPQDKTITEDQAFRAALKSAERAARQAYRAGMKHVADTIPGIKKMLLDKAKQNRLDIEAVRRTIRSMVQKHIDPAEQGKFLVDVERATTAAAIARALDKMRLVASEHRFKEAYARSNKAIKLANKTNLTQERRTIIAQAKLRAEPYIFTGATTTVTRKDGVTYERRVRRTYNSADEFREAADALESVDQTIRSIIADQRHEHQLRLQGRVLMREKVVQTAQANIAKGKQLKKPADMSETAYATFLGRAKQAHLTPDTIGVLLNDPTLRRLLVDEMWDGETLVNRDSQRGDDALQANVEASGFNWGTDRLQRLSAAASNRDATRQVMALPDAGDLVATPAEWMALYATLTDAGAGARIREGAPIVWDRDKNNKSIEISEADADHVIRTLDPDLKAIVDRAKQYVEREVRPGIFKAFRDQKGYDLEPVQNYWRTRRRRDQQLEKGLIETMKATLSRSLVNLGFLQERVEDSSTPYVIGDFFKDYHEIVHSGAVVTHMTRRVRNAEVIFEDVRIKAAVESKFGQQMNGRIRDIIEAGKLLFHEPRTGMEKFASFLNRNLARAKLTANISTFLKQIGGTFKLFGMIDASFVAKGISTMKSTEVDDIMQNGAYFRDRYEGSIWRRYTPSLSRRTPLLGESSALDAAKRVLSRRVFGAISELIDKNRLLNAFDAVPVRAAIAAKIAEFDGRFGHLNYPPERRRRWIERQAEQVIRRTQNTHSELDMSGAALDLRGNPLASPILMFTSDNNKSLNMLIAAQARGKKAFARALIAVSLNNAWAAGVTTMMRFGTVGLAVAALGGGDDDRKNRKKAGESFAIEFARNMLSLGYFGDKLASVGEAIYDSANDRPIYRNNILRDNPVEQAIGNAVFGMVDIGRAAFADGNFKSGPRKGQSKATAALLDGFEQAGTGTLDLLGVPFSPVFYQAKRIAEATEEQPRKKELAY